jgi:hypothetical protein
MTRLTQSSERRYQCAEIGFADPSPLVDREQFKDLTNSANSSGIFGRARAMEIACGRHQAADPARWRARGRGLWL